LRRIYGAPHPISGGSSQASRSTGRVKGLMPA
jgi:hypothetical protein